MVPFSFSLFYSELKGEKKEKPKLKFSPSAHPRVIGKSRMKEKGFRRFKRFKIEISDVTVENTTFQTTKKLPRACIP